MKYMLLVLLSVILVSGCVGSVQMIDCGNSEACFKENMKNCTAAKYTYSESDDLGNQFETYGEIRGMEGENCVFYMKILKADIPEESLELFPELANFEGSDMLCKMPLSMLTGDEIVTDSEDVFDPLGGYCAGSYKDIMDAFMQRLKDMMEGMLEMDFDDLDPEEHSSFKRDAGAGI